MARAAKVQAVAEMWREGVGQASPEQSEQENTHHARMWRMESRLQELLTENDEALLRDAYEHSQLRLEVEDTFKDQVREELENEFEDRLEAMKSKITNALESA